MSKPIAWLHEIKEPTDKEWHKMYSESPVSPWAHWQKQYADQCEYRLTALYGGPHEPSWGQIVQLLLRAMDTATKEEKRSAQMLAMRMADGIQCLFGLERTKPHPINDAIRKPLGPVPGDENPLEVT